MAKPSGTTRTISSGSASSSRSTSSILGGGSGVARGNSFAANTKINQFEGSSSLEGGYYTLMTKDGR